MHDCVLTQHLVLPFKGCFLSRRKSKIAVAAALEVAEVLELERLTRFL